MRPFLSRAAALDNSPRREPWVSSVSATPSPGRGERNPLSPLPGLVRSSGAGFPTARAVGYCLTPLPGLVAATILIAAVLLTASPAWAQGITLLGGPEEQEDETKPTLTLVLHPAPEPRPALKYQFLPTVLERHHGNAAVYYGKVTAEQIAFFSDNELWKKINEWSDAPLAELREAKRSGECPLPKDLFMLNWAARCDTCDWELPFREYRPTYDILLPEMQQSHRFARLLAANTRMQIAEGKYDKAVDTLATGYSLAYDVAQGQFLVCSLSGAAHARRMSHQVEAFVQQPDAPNLYWALATLPRPFIDLRAALDVERDMLYLCIPELQKANDVQHDACYWPRVVDQLASHVALLRSRNRGKNEEASGWRARLESMKDFPKGKEYLQMHGFSSDRVDAMLLPEVVGRYSLAIFNELRDDEFKWAYVPYWKAAHGAKDAERRWRDSLVEGREVIPLTDTFMASAYRAYHAAVRPDRQVAALMVVEALRMHAANKGGALPVRLEDVTEVPVPEDPVTGKAFEYERHGDTATLSGPPLTEERLRWEIRMAE